MNIKKIKLIVDTITSITLQLSCCLLIINKNSHSNKCHDTLIRIDILGATAYSISKLIKENNNYKELLKIEKEFDRFLSMNKENIYFLKSYIDTISNSESMKLFYDKLCKDLDILYTELELEEKTIDVDVLKSNISRMNKVVEYFEYAKNSIDNKLYNDCYEFMNDVNIKYNYILESDNISIPSIIFIETTVEQCNALLRKERINLSYNGNENLKEAYKNIENIILE